MCNHQQMVAYLPDEEDKNWAIHRNGNAPLRLMWMGPSFMDAQFLKGGSGGSVVLTTFGIQKRGESSFFKCFKEFSSCVNLPPLLGVPDSIHWAKEEAVWLWSRHHQFPPWPQTCRLQCPCLPYLPVLHLSFRPMAQPGPPAQDKAQNRPLLLTARQH